MLQVEVAAKKERLNDLQGELRALETRHASFKILNKTMWWTVVVVCGCSKFCSADLTFLFQIYETASCICQ